MTYDNGDETHWEGTPKHSTHQVVDAGGKEPLEADIPCDITDTEQSKDDDVEDEDDDPEAL